MASPQQLQPLQVDLKTGECFIRLPAPHNNIVIGQPRMEDTAVLQPILNDLAVSYWLGLLPSPYTMDHAEDWQKKVTERAKTVLESLAAGDQFVGDCPVRTIREIREDGSELFLGDIGIQRLNELERSVGGTEENKEKLKEENDKKVAGDPSIAWTIGYYIRPSHQGRGIMSAVVNALIHQWAIPRMNMHVAVGTAFIGNDGSMRILQKNGFVWREAREKYVKRGDEVLSIHILDWQRK